MDIYINRVDQCPCGETCIHFCKGADSSDKQERRPYLIQYLKGTIKEKQVLQQQHKELYDNFEVLILSCVLWQVWLLPSCLF